MKKSRVIIGTAIIALFASLAIVHAAPVQRIHEIQSPLFSVPVIVKADDSFSVKLKLAEGEKPEAAYLNGVDDPTVRYELLLSPAKDEDGMTVVSAAVPASVPVALYDLSIRLGDEAWDFQPHSVKVIKEVKNEFDFIQLTDIHFNVQYIKKADMNRIRRKLLQDISKENVEFVIFTGDLGLNPETYDWDYVYGYEELLQWMRQPMYMIPGITSSITRRRGTASRLTETNIGKRITGRRTTHSITGNCTWWA